MKKRKLKIKQTKANIFYIIIGRITTYLLIYAFLIALSVQIIGYILTHYVTTIK